MAHDVFVSYASADKTVADAVCATLESHGIRCWIAPRDVLPGIHYGEAIIDAIHECRIMVLVFSSKANISGHIPKEIERAVSQGVTVMPLRIEDVAPAKSLDYFIGSVHWLDALTPPLEVHLQRLAANVKTLLSRPDSRSESRTSPANAPAVSPVTPAAARATRHSGRPKWEYFVIGGLAAVVLILGFLTYRSRSQQNVATAQIAATKPAALPAQTSGAVPAAEPDNPKKLLAPVSAAAPTNPPAVSAAAASTSPPAARPAKPVREVALHFMDDSTVKLEQLIGNEDKERHKPTVSQTFTRFGVEGTELGVSFEHQAHAYFLFGPTLGRLPGLSDTIATTDTANPNDGVHLDFLTNGGKYIAAQPAGITMAPMDVPVAGISLDGQMYVAFSTNFTRGGATNRTVLTKFAAPETFQTVRMISELPQGRFIRMSMHVQPGPVVGLPAGGPFILTWGTGKYRESDAYLSIVPVGQFEAGKGIRYFAGLDASNAPAWSDNESDATPIVKDGTLGDLSVTWCKDLGLWLMAYDRRTQPNGIAFSYSRTPWGPWSEPQILFNPVRDNAYGRFIHAPLRKIDDGLEGPVLGQRNRVSAAEVRGGAFAPYVVERWTRVQGSELELYYVISTINPYVVVLMKSLLQIE
ncbi:MAG TPA: DUF4185 domain-containing protein [Candidatus Acidoferrum sp.]|nr:DUF4185 domain-containing protein [Candidatus Acidoferrum sp.]